MAKDDDILRDAIIGTEKEIAASAFDQEDLTLDETGDRGLEAMGDGLEGQNDPDEDGDGDNEPDSPDDGDDDDPHPSEEPENPDAVEAQAKPEAETKTEEPKGRVPAGRLREEAEKARAAVAERDALKAQLDAEKATSQKAIADLNAKFEALLALQRQQPSAPPAKPEEPVKAPDLFEDPNAFAEHLRGGMKSELDALRKELRDQQVNASIEEARSKHGQTFEDAFGALKGLDYRNPDNIALVKRMEAAPNPGEAIVSWHKRNQAIRTVGDDLDAYNARIADETRKSLMADPEFRKELLASLRGEALTGDQGRPRTAVKLPGSLARTPGSNTRAPNDLEIFDGSESAIAASAWST